MLFIDFAGVRRQKQATYVPLNCLESALEASIDM